MKSMFLGRFFPKPKILVFFISFNCNLRCAMCFGWVKQKKVKEPSLSEIKTIFSNPALKNNLEIINITGGEPTLREDLPEIIEIILQNCPYLRRIDLSTNGVNTEQVLDQVERILAALLPTNVKLGVSISLDGTKEIHEKVRQSSGIFDQIEKTAKQLKELSFLYPYFSLGFNMTISKINYREIDDLSKYAKEKGIGLNLTLSAVSDIGVESVRIKDRFVMSIEEKNTVASSLMKIFESGGIDKSYLQFLLTWLSTGKRSGACAFRSGKALLLEPDGELYLCGNFKEFRLGNLIKEPFSFIWRKRKKFPQSAFVKCINCSSNCYWDEKG